MADGDIGFEVVLARTGTTLAVPAGRSILDVLEAHGHIMASSCHEGVCGTCETDVLEGVPEHRDHVLSKRERDSNRTMMICCSRALTPRLVLDI